MAIDCFAIYIDADFYIYDLPYNPAILFHGQLTTHFKSISGKASNDGRRNQKLAGKLAAMHNNSYRPTNLPDYSLISLKKGIVCKECNSFEYSKSRQMQTCMSCGHREKTADAIHRSIEEFRLLFPEKPVTKKGIYDWCGKNWSESMIKRVLKKHYQLHSSSRSSYYD